MAESVRKETMSEDRVSMGSCVSIGTVNDIGMRADGIMDDARSIISQIATGHLKKSISCSVLEGIMDHKSVLGDLGIDEDEEIQVITCCPILRSKRQEPPRYQKFLEDLLALLRHGTGRETWANQTEFILSLVGYAIGLGNIWRFPYLTYKNGGGAFLVPYLIMLVIAGLPLFFFELSFGQFASTGIISIWKICPLLKGVGYGMLFISTTICTYYNVIIMYAAYYMFVSMVSLDSGLPWESCNNPWNTKWCVQYAKGKPNGTLDVLQRICPDMLNTSSAKLEAANNLSFCGISNFTTASQEYWTNVVLRLPESDGIGDLGPISLKNFMFLFLTWFVIYLCLRKGVKSTGKVVYFTATFPYLILIILLFRGLTLEGYMEGIKFYIIPKWEKLTDINVWADAATQIFYSLGLAFGSLINMSSYNKFDNNCYRHALSVAFINSMTSILGGFVIFSFLGYMSFTTGRPMESIADSGSGLVFVAYPEGLAQMPVSSVWSFCFFFMILTLGLDSQFAIMEAVIGSIIDELPEHLRNRKSQLTAIACTFCFILGIPMTTAGGIYVLTILDTFSGSYSLMAICFTELIAVNWIYGFKNFSQDIKMMLGFEPGIYWKATWMVISPLTILFILVMTAIGHSQALYVNYVFEEWAQGIGWLLVIFPVAMIFITAIVQIFRYDKSLRKAIQPAKDWGPALGENRWGRYANYQIEASKDAVESICDDDCNTVPTEPTPTDQITKL